MPPKKRAHTRGRPRKAQKSKAPRRTSPLSADTSLPQLMAMTMLVLREHLTQRQLSVGGNKQTLARRLLMDLQSGREPEQTSHKSGEEGQSQPFTPAQQAALESAVRAALTKVSSPTLSNPSTSIIHKRHRASRLPSRSRKRRKQDRTLSSSSSSRLPSSESSSQDSTPGTRDSRSTTTSPTKHSQYSSASPSPRKQERSTRRKHSRSTTLSRKKLRKRKHHHHKHTPRSLPVPQKFSKSIVRGEFIEFPKLLAGHMAMAGVLRQPKSGHEPEPRGITGLDTWLDAWCIFASVLTAVKPRLAPDLFRYQNYIVLASRRFQPHAWLQYDIQFRLKMASNPDMSWSTADPELTATWLSADAILPKVNCYLCGSPNHLAPTCPANTVGKSAGLRCPVCNGDGHTARSCPMLAPTSQKQQKSLPSSDHKGISDNKICRIFNQKGSCFRGSRCPYFHIHVCNKCKGGHPERACPDRI